MEKQQHSYQSQYETINLESRIAATLVQIQQKQTRLSLKVDGVIILDDIELEEVAASDNTFTIQPISAAEHIAQIQQSKRILFTCQHNGTDFSFNGEYLGSVGEKRHPKLKFKQPHEIRYFQRRATHRVHISLALGINAEVVTKNGVKYAGVLRDISLGGMRVQLNKNTSKEFSSRGQLSECTIVLPDSTDVQCQFELKHVEPHLRNRGCTIGGSFLELEQDQQRLIEKFIAILERQSRRSLLA